MGLMLEVLLVVMFAVGASEGPPLSFPLGVIVTIFIVYIIPMLIVVFALKGELAYHFKKWSRLFLV